MCSVDFTFRISHFISQLCCHCYDNLDCLYLFVNTSDLHCILDCGQFEYINCKIKQLTECLIFISKTQNN